MHRYERVCIEDNVFAQRAMNRKTKRWVVAELREEATRMSTTYDAVQCVILVNQRTCYMSASTLIMIRGKTKRATEHVRLGRHVLVLRESQ